MVPRLNVRFVYVELKTKKKKKPDLMVNRFVPSLLSFDRY